MSGVIWCFDMSGDGADCLVPVNISEDHLGELVAMIRVERQIGFTAEHKSR